MGGFYETLYLILSYLILSFSLAFGYSPEKIEIIGSCRKVPKERNKMKIEFFAKAKFGFYENVSFYVFGENLSVIEISPNSPILIDENGTFGYAIINLEKEDEIYKVYLNAKIGDRIASRVLFYLRNVQGNALELTEQQYLFFLNQKEQMWMNSEAEEHAKADLEGLRTRGLKIAVEKWPKDGESFSPLENNIGLTLELQDNSLYEIKFTENAINNPIYRDIVSVQLNPVDPNCYYANFTSLPIDNEPLCVNQMAHLKIVTKLYREYVQTDWIQNPIDAKISYYGFVEDRCTDSCKVKAFSQYVQINPLYVPGGKIIGIAYATVNVPPSNYFVLESIDFLTYNSKVRAGDCEMESDLSSSNPECWENHLEWQNGSEHVYFGENGSYGSGKMIETVRCDQYSYNIPECNGFREDPNDPLHIKKYVAIVNVKNYPSEANIKVEKIEFFNRLQNINNFWSDTFEQYYLDYRACPREHGDSYFTAQCNANYPIIAIVGYATSDLDHETGHWLQYRMQRNWLEGGGNWEICQYASPETGFSEGFAEWHKYYITLEGSYEQDSECGHENIMYPANKFNFLWDVFDTPNDPIKDNYCFDCSKPHQDLIYLQKHKLLNWIGHRYNDIIDFIYSFLIPNCTRIGGQPCQGYEVCTLLNVHNYDLSLMNCN